MDSTGTTDPLLVGFGVNGSTGDYLAPAVSVDALTEAVISVEQPLSEQQLSNFNKVKSKQFLGDLGDLNQTQWGVIFAADETDGVKQAMQKLIDHRYCPPNHVFTYRGENYNDWIRNNGGQPGSTDTDIIPFYLCIVGGPDKIPFDFQFNLDIEYGVGRLAFDSPADYAQYIDNVIAYETPQNKPANRKQVVMMGAANPNDNATHLSSQYLIQPLTDIVTKTGFGLTTYLAPDVAAGRSDVQGPMSKANLSAFFARPNNQLPALLFTASHGWGFTAPHPAQAATQGALVCQDWPCSGNDPGYYFAAADVPANADLRGMVMFSFACYGAGTPRMSYYKRLWGVGQEAQQAATPIAATDFIAALPKKLMARPNGILGFFGHIEQTWAHSFVHQQSPGQLVADILAFKTALNLLLQCGYPLGATLTDFNSRNAVYTPQLSDLLEAKLSRQPVNDADLSGKWIDRNDARSFILLGDPAASLRIKELQS